MWSDLRADAARRELTALASAGLDDGTLQAAAAEIVRRVVPYDATCWAPIDPDSHVFTGSVTLHFDPGPDLKTRFAEIEAAGTDVNTFQALARSRTPVARLSDVDRDVLSASPRLSEIYRPLGFGFELRTVFTVDGRCWGIAELLRGKGGAEFSDHEVDFVASIGTVMADGLRRAVLFDRAHDADTTGSAVVVLNAAGEIVATTPQADQRLAALNHAEPDGGPQVLRSVVAAAGIADAGRAQARLRDATGAWVTITGTRLRTTAGDEQVAVTIEPMHANDLTDLLLSAHGLTAREQDVCRAAVAGQSTAAIAASLFISANTVQDHLKSIFAKTGIRSRRELVAHLSGGASTN